MGYNTKYNMRPIIVNGVQFASIKEAADSLGTTSIQLSKKMKRLRDAGLDDSNFNVYKQGKNIRLITDNSSTMTNKNVAFGVEYSSFEELCKAHNVHTSTINKRMKTHGWSVEQALTNSTIQIEYKGEVYRNLKELCDKLGLNYNTIRGKIYVKGETIEQAVNEYHSENLDRTVISATVYGVRYNSFRELSRVFGLSNHLITRRIKSGWDLEAAVVAGAETSQKFIGLDNKAYYSVKWSEKPVKTRQIIEHYRPDLLEAYDRDNPIGEYRPYIRK